MAAVLLLTLRGTPILYYGDEIGMTNVPIPRDRVHDPWEHTMPGFGVGRDPARTPMQWDASPQAGFTTGTPWLPISADVESTNVATRAKPLRHSYGCTIGSFISGAMSRSSFWETTTDCHPPLRFCSIFANWTTAGVWWH
jgi:glycosidase